MKTALVALVCIHWGFNFFYTKEILHQGLLAPTKWLTAEEQVMDFVNDLPVEQRSTVQFAATRTTYDSKITVFYCDKFAKAKP